MSRDDERSALLDAILAEVPFDGWTRRSFTLAAKSLGLAEGDVGRLFPGGAVEMIAFWNERADRATAAAMAALDPGPKRVRDIVATATRMRIEGQAGHREAVRRALSVLALPGHAATAARLLYRTVDEIWHLAGDTATDWNFYSKRGLLAGVYASTLMFWLDDQSEGSAESWAFLERRLADTGKIPKALQKIKARLPNPRLLFGRA